MKTFKQISEQINENLLMQKKLSKLVKKKVTVITPNDSITGELVFNFGYLNRPEYFVDGYENEIFTDRDVKSIRGNKISLKKDFVPENTIKEDNFDEIEKTADELLRTGKVYLQKVKQTRRKNINAAKRQFKIAKVRLANAKSKADVKIAKQQLAAAVVSFQGGDKREIKQLKLDLKRAKAERKAELELAKSELDQAKFDLKNVKDDREELNIAKAEVRTAQDMVRLAQLKAEAFEVTENMLNESL